MKRFWFIGLFVFLFAMALTACSTTTTSSTTSSLTTSLTSSSSTTTSFTTSSQTTSTTTLPPTTSTTVTTQPLVYQGILVEGVTGDGNEANPYLLSTIVKENTTVPFSLLPIGLDAEVRIYQGLKTSFGIFPLTPDSIQDIDFVQTSDSQMVFQAKQLGELYIVILVDDQHPTYLKLDVQRKPMTVDFTKQLRVLAIGNSFSVDSMEYLYKLAADAGIEEIILGNLYIPGAALSTHLTSYQNEMKNYVYYKNTNDQWVAQSSSSLLDGLTDEDWDIITIQQVSGSSGRVETYNQQLEQLIQVVQNHQTNPDARIVWHMTWAYQQNSTHGDFVHYQNNQMTMYEGIVNAVQTRIMNHIDIQFFLPAGTAIQNLRTSYMGDTLTVDGYHLSLNHGRYTAALTWLKTIVDIDLTSIEYMPNGMTLQDLEAIKEAVENAVKSPFSITPSTYLVKEINEEPIPDPITVQSGLNLKMVGKLGFWSALTSLQIIDQDSNSNRFVSTNKQYTKKDIPLGSILVIPAGITIEAHFFSSDQDISKSRISDPLSNQIITVDDTWWGDHWLVGFTITLGPDHDLTNRVDEVIEYFKILLPVEELVMNFKLGFYNSTGSHLLVTGDPISKNFVAADVRYSKAQIPVGSIILIESGYRYRANFWKSLEGGFAENFRTDNLTNPWIVVDEAWWGSQEYVSFNVSPVAGGDLTERVDEVASKLKVYVPGTRVVPLQYQLGFYNSTGSHLLVTGDPISKNFIAVNQRFSKEELPVGSVIIIEEGYRYRVNFWKNLDAGFGENRRTDNLTTYIVIIDEAWWGDQEYVSFNISPVSGGDLTNRVEEVASKFLILR